MSADYPQPYGYIAVDRVSRSWLLGRFLDWLFFVQRSARALFNVCSGSRDYISLDDLGVMSQFGAPLDRNASRGFSASDAGGV